MGATCRYIIPSDIHSNNKQEGLAVARIARDVVEMTPPRDDNAR